MMFRDREIAEFSQNSYLFCFLWFWPFRCTEFVSLRLFEFDAMFLFLRLLLVIWFSLLLFLRLLLTWTLDAPSNRSLSESPITRKFGNRIQQVLTEHDPDIPWHLHSSRISDWTCCKRKRKIEINYWKKKIFSRSSKAINFTSRACQVAEWVLSPQVAHRSKKQFLNLHQSDNRGTAWRLLPIISW